MLHCCNIAYLQHGGSNYCMQKEFKSQPRNSLWDSSHIEYMYLLGQVWAYGPTGLGCVRECTDDIGVATWDLGWSSIDVEAIWTINRQVRSPMIGCGVGRHTPTVSATHHAVAVFTCLLIQRFLCSLEKLLPAIDRLLSAHTLLPRC